RSHDAMHDKKSDADAIIIFINYLLGLIDKSTSSFEEKEFLARVFDPYYVQSTEYSNLLIHEIPKRQRANIAILVILGRERGDRYALNFFLQSLFEQLEDAELLWIYQ